MAERPKMPSVEAADEGKSVILARRLDALRRANEIRSERAELKRALRQGEASIVELLAEPPRALRTARLSDILVCLPGYGEVRVRDLLKRCRIGPLKTVGGLSERQRRELTLSLS